MSFAWHDILGTLGVLLIVLAYAGIQFRWIRAEALAYSFGNGVGAVLILISLLVEFNFSAFLMETVWLALSIYGVVKWTRQNRRRQGA